MTISSNFPSHRYNFCLQLLRYQNLQSWKGHAYFILYLKRTWTYVDVLRDQFIEKMYFEINLLKITLQVLGDILTLCHANFKTYKNTNADMYTNHVTLKWKDWLFLKLCLVIPFFSSCTFRYIQSFFSLDNYPIYHCNWYKRNIFIKKLIFFIVISELLDLFM